ncbi:MAG: chromate transporter [Intestinimonas sp.]|jgi:chromate transporter|nr:chromate transporter [Intestinimonas sp.]
MILPRLFWEFFKTGLFSVGGGLATLPFLSRMADSTGWFNQSQLADMVAVSESTPGPIGVNMATYVGFTVSGVPGAIIATLGLVAPSIVIILLITAFLRNFQNNRYVKSVFGCLRPASTGLIAASGLSVAVITLLNSKAVENLPAAVNWKAVILAALLLLLTRGIHRTGKLHPIVWILASAAVGVVFHFGGV